MVTVRPIPKEITYPYRPPRRVAHAVGPVTPITSRPHKSRWLRHRNLMIRMQVVLPAGNVLASLAYCSTSSWLSVSSVVHGLHGLQDLHYLFNPPDLNYSCQIQNNKRKSVKSVKPVNLQMARRLGSACSPVPM
jgi:hypothetical protein